tara:strand:- start:1554 stop:3041 length:1488 start_codon:yes stop_codon:yes gene_type:complete
MPIKLSQGVDFKTQSVSVSELKKHITKGDTGLNAVLSTFAGLLQRINQEVEWFKNDYKRCKEFMYCLLTGAGALDNIIIVPIELVIESLKIKMSRDTDIPKEIWDATISVIEKDKENGTLHYIIDGQNRLMNAIKGYYEDLFPLGPRKLSYIDNNEEVILSGKKYSELNKESQEYIDNIKLSVLVATTGDIDSFVDSLIAKNEGLPWTEWMKIMTKNWFSIYRNKLKDIGGNPQVKEALNKISGKEYSYDTNGHDKIISELLIWMKTKHQPAKDSQHLSYLSGMEKVKSSHYNLLQKYILEFNKVYRISKIKSYTNTEFRNYVMLRYAMDHRDEFPNVHIPSITVNAVVDFVSQYKIFNKVLRDDPDNYLPPVNGVKSNVKRPQYFKWACSEYKPQFIDCRLNLLFKEFTKKQSELERMGVIKTVVDTLSMPSIEEIYHNNPTSMLGEEVRPSEVSSDTFDRGHIVAKNNGGSNEISNLKLHEKGHNRSIKDTNL